MRAQRGAVQSSISSQSCQPGEWVVQWVVLVAHLGGWCVSTGKQMGTKAGCDKIKQQLAAPQLCIWCNVTDGGSDDAVPALLQQAAAAMQARRHLGKVR